MDDHLGLHKVDCEAALCGDMDQTGDTFLLDLLKRLKVLGF